MPSHMPSATGDSSSGRLFVVSAPSGCGKTTITGRLQQLGLVSVSVSYTTRPPRASEENDKQYHFIKREEFLHMRDNGVFLEWAEVFGHYYGTGKEWVRTQLAGAVNILLEIDVQGGLHIKKTMPETVLIFIRPPSLEVLAERLHRRGQDSAEVIAHRLDQAESEIKRATDYDYVIINNELEAAIAEIAEIINNSAASA